MQHKCPMCGCLFYSHYTPQGVQALSWTLYGNEWTSTDGGYSWTTPRKTGLLRVVQMFQLLMFCFVPWEKLRVSPSRITSSNGPANPLDQLKKQLAEPHNGLAGLKG